MKMTTYRMRVDKRKRENEESLDDSHLKIVVVDTMGELELKTIELVKDTVPLLVLLVFFSFFSPLAFGGFYLPQCC